MRIAKDCSASSPGLVVLAPTDTPTLAPPGPLEAENPKARLAYKDGAKNAARPAPI